MIEFCLQINKKEPSKNVFDSNIDGHISTETRKIVFNRFLITPRKVSAADTLGFLLAAFISLFTIIKL